MRRRSKLLAVATATGLAGTLAVFGSTTASAAGPVTGLGGKCVDVAGASTANGAHVQLYDCNGSAAQSWTVGNSDNTVRPGRGAGHERDA